MDSMTEEMLLKEKERALSLLTPNFFLHKKRGGDVFENPYEDFYTRGESEFLGPKKDALRAGFRKENERMIHFVLQTMNNYYDNRTMDFNDKSVYSGVGGVIGVYYHLGKLRGDPSLESRAERLLGMALDGLEDVLDSRRRPSMLLGEGGLLAVGAVISYHAGNEELAKKMYSHLCDFEDVFMDENSDLPDNLALGRAGHLLCHIYLMSKGASELVDSLYVERCVSFLLNRGRGSKHVLGRWPTPLYYPSGEEKPKGGDMSDRENDMGTLYGMTGILYVLLKCRSFMSRSEFFHSMQPTIRYLVESYMSPSYPYYKSLHDLSSGDVDWCTGATGIILLALEAHSAYAKEEFLMAAEDLGELVWKRGLVRYGYSLCHGVAGNGYALLALYRATGDEKWYHRALCFGSWCHDFGRHNAPMPDKPFSVFLGIPGIACFLQDLTAAKEGAFPYYDL